MKYIVYLTLPLVLLAGASVPTYAMFSRGTKKTEQTKNGTESAEAFIKALKKGDHKKAKKILQDITNSKDSDVVNFFEVRRKGSGLNVLLAAVATPDWELVLDVVKLIPRVKDKHVIRNLLAATAKREVLNGIKEHRGRTFYSLLTEDAPKLYGEISDIIGEYRGTFKNREMISIFHWLLEQGSFGLINHILKQISTPIAIEAMDQGVWNINVDAEIPNSSAYYKLLELKPEGFMHLVNGPFLFALAGGGNFTQISLLFEAFKKTQAKLDTVFDLLAMRDPDGNTMLHLIIKNKRLNDDQKLAIVKRLLDPFLPRTKDSKTQDSPLMKRKRLVLIQKLVLSVFSVENKQGETLVNMPHGGKAGRYIYDLYKTYYKRAVEVLEGTRGKRVAEILEETMGKRGQK